MSEAGAGPDPFAKWLSDRDLDVGTFAGAPFLEARFSWSDGDRAAAWALHVELRSRITTQALPFHSGDEGTALASLASLFQFLRDLLADQGAGAGRMGLVALWMLNDRVRPVTAFWHPAAIAGRLQIPDDAGDFRGDLRALQHHLRVFADVLGFIALDADYAAHRFTDPPRAGDRNTPEAPAVPKVDTSWIARESELADVATRRTAFEVESLSAAPASSKTSETRRHDLVGLALSGGGIRSATFSMGVLQALSDHGLYRFFDYMSTVSGGGYTGSLISSWARGREAQAARWGPFRRAAVAAQQAEPRAVTWIRDRSRYLVEGGPLALLAALVPIGLGILGATATLYLLVCLALAPVFGGAWLVSWVASWDAWRGEGSAGQTSTGAASAIALVAGFLGIRLARVWGGPRVDEWLAGLLVAAGAFPASYGLVHLLNAAFDRGQDWIGSALPSTVSYAAVAAALPTVLTVVSKLLQRRKTLARAGGWLLLVSPWVALASATALLYRYLTEADGALRADAWQGPFAFAAAALVLALLVDVNEMSPRAHYRNRLAAAYCVSSADGVTATARAVHLDELSANAPFHLVNATVNLPSSRARNLRGRKAFPFVFSKRGWLHPVPDAYGDLQPRHTPKPPGRTIDLATAMAISGAAVSSLMGTEGPAGATPWLTLFNLRLGYWLPNPGHVGSLPCGYYLLKEYLGRASEGDACLNVSDGGHFENLGVYELLRRRCRYVVAIDGGADCELACGGLMKLIRLARIDFGAAIRIDVGKLGLSPDHLSAAHFAWGEIRYADGTLGRLLYIKLSVTGDEPGYLLTYRDREPAFPHHSTADQLFSEEQFEAYRALGEHIGGKLFSRELVGVELAERAAMLAGGQSDDPLTQEEFTRWLASLDEQLLPRPRFGTMASAAAVAVMESVAPYGGPGRTSVVHS